MMEAAGPAPRAFLRVGGTTLARHQLVLALRCGCERIICLSRTLGPDVIELQHDAEKAGASFHVVGGARGLSGLISAADEVLVFAEGLLPTTGDALRLLEGPAAVLVQPAEVGVPAGYERIDLNYAWAGLMLVPGRLVDRLTELPPDAEVSSALLRIALQAGVPQRPVPDAVRAAGRWLLVRTEDEAHSAEDEWIVRHTADASRTPGPLLARLLVRKFGPALLHGDGSNLILTAMAVVLAGAGLAAAWVGFHATGLVFLGAGWVVGRAWAQLAYLRSESLARYTRRPWLGSAFDVAFDLAIIFLLVLIIPALPGQTVWERAFAPAMLIGLLRLVARGLLGPHSQWADDRLVLVLVLAVLIAGGITSPGVTVAAAVLLVGTLFATRRRSASELTRA